MKKNKFFFFACQFHKNSIVKESSNFLSSYPFHKSFKFYYKRFKIFQKYIFLSKFQKNDIFLARNFHTDNFSKISGRKIERERERERKKQYSKPSSTNSISELSSTWRSRRGYTQESTYFRWSGGGRKTRWKWLARLSKTILLSNPASRLATVRARRLNRD